MLVEVLIHGTVVTPQYGALSSGDVLRTTSDFAKHLVEVCKVAKYSVKHQAEHVKKPRKWRSKGGE